MLNRRNSAKVLLAVLLLGGKAFACDCIASKPCGGLRTGDSDFTAEILSKSGVIRDESNGPSFPYLVFTMRVLESFGSNQKSGDIVKVRTGLGDGDCGYPFKIGEKYFVDSYLDATKTKRNTGLCSFTGSLGNRALVLRELRARKAGQRLPDVTGEVTRLGHTAAEAGTGVSNPMRGAQVVLHSSSSRTSLRAVTDTEGIYAFPHISPGTYSITMDHLPVGLEMSSVSVENYGDKDFSLVIPKEPSNNPECHVLISVDFSGSISGHISAAPEVLQDGAVFVSTQDASGKKVEDIDVDFSKNNGVFHVLHLPAGHYEIKFVSGLRKLTGKPSKTLSVDIGLGEQKNGIDISVR